jgi:hypothetical protein
MCFGDRIRSCSQAKIFFQTHCGREADLSLKRGDLFIFKFLIFFYWIVT